jgi:AhpD family alkylhydroperoxidase
MSYEQTRSEMEKTFGSMPGFFQAVPKDVMTQMWPIMKKYIFGQSSIPPKYREMIGLAVAAALKCPYCETFHRGAAQMNGATEEELAEVGVLVGQTSFWSSILHTQNYDMNTFMKEFQAMGEYAAKQQQVSAR